MNSNINGQAAEIMIQQVLMEMTASHKPSPKSYDEVMKVIDERYLPHTYHALECVERYYGSLQVGVHLILDQCLGIDGFFENEDGELFSYDVTVDTSTKTFNHKCTVQEMVAPERTKLGFNNHILVYVITEKSYAQLTDNEKWNIIDQLEAASHKVQSGSMTICKIVI